MRIKIITPDQHIFEGETSAAKFPGSSGSFEVLKDHAPIISLLDSGNVRLKTPEGELSWWVEGGVVEVLNNEIVVLAEAVRK